MATRRQVLHAMGALAASRLWVRASVPAASLQTPDTVPLRPVSMALHVHASFSEGAGSMEAQLDQAVRNDVEVLWWTEHDWRMSGHGYRRAVDFTGPRELEDGYAWLWKEGRGGAVAEGGARFARDEHGRQDWLELTARAGTSAGNVSCQADDSQSRGNHRGSLAGMVLEVDLLPLEISRTEFLEVEVVTSYRPARDGLPAGTRTVRYRAGGRARTPGLQVNGREVIVTLDAPPGEWSTHHLKVDEDLSAAWPGLQGRDAALIRLRLRAAAARGEQVRGGFDQMRFRRDTAGDRPLVAQRELMDAYAPQFPSVVQHGGLEVSLHSSHVNWFGSGFSLPDYSGYRLIPGTDTEVDWALLREFVDTIHGQGGLASYNHPFGAAGGRVPATEAAQNRKLSLIAGRLARERAFGVDLLEVGYRVRGAVTLERHLALWDTCSNNAIFLAGVGVSDNHGGGNADTGWANPDFSFITWAWAPSAEETDLIGALGTGQAWVADMLGFNGTVDLVVDGQHPMGSATVSSDRERAVRVAVQGTPSGGEVRVVQGLVSFRRRYEPGIIIRREALPPAAFTDGVVDVICDTRRSSFVRVEVADATGRVVAFSNPVWLLRDVPPDGIPPGRTA
jgi:hypothetical protein